MKIKEWTILFHPIFNQQWQELLANVKQLKSRLVESEYVKHPQVKLFAALTIIIEQKIPQDPLASYFALKKPLNRYCRVKKMGLPSRYRLFFKVFKEQKVIIILWLGFPRKEGDKKDCYQVFKKMLDRGKFPQSLADLENELN
jgi:toxin YhaV